nr:hypothetical protein [Ensifer sp. BR816]
MDEVMRFVGGRSDDAFGNHRRGGDRRAATQRLRYRASNRFRNWIDSCHQFDRIAEGDGSGLSGNNAGIHRVEEIFLDHFAIVPHGSSQCGR